MSKPLIVRQKFVLPFHFQALIVLFFGSGIITTFFATPTITTVLMVIVVSTVPILLALSRNLITFDGDQQQIVKSVMVLGFQFHFGRYKFHQIERLFLNKVKTTQRIGGFVQQRELKDVFFKTFIKFHDGEKWFLDEDHDYDALRKRTLTYQKLVWAPFVDNFGNQIIQ